jgi:hypothetical protein
MNKDNIFISYSKQVTHDVAKVIEELIYAIYPKGSSNVDVFLSSKRIKAGAFKDQILDAMKNAKFAISILSPENINAPWLMFEAGALTMAVEQNGGKFMPYLFCRHASKREATIDDLQYAQYQKDYKENQNQLFILLQNLNASLSKSNQVDELQINSKINDHWDSISKRLDVIAYNLINPGASSAGAHSLDNVVNHSISINPIEGRFETNQQSIVRLADDFVPKTPREIESKFEEMLRTQVPVSWKHRNDSDKIFNATRVIVNSTRFSTFVAFTDGVRIVLFDRARDRANTSVTNERFDVFGSVQFENRTIKSKIKNDAFFDTKIIRVEEISGAAIEDNILKAGSDTETAVMFGACIYMSPEDLDLAKIGATNNEIVIYSISAMHKIKSEWLTSKAMLSVSHIIASNEKTKI